MEYLHGFFCCSVASRGQRMLPCQYGENSEAPTFTMLQCCRPWRSTASFWRTTRWISPTVGYPPKDDDIYTVYINIYIYIIYIYIYINGKVMANSWDMTLCGLFGTVQEYILENDDNNWLEFGVPKFQTNLFTQFGDTEGVGGVGGGWRCPVMSCV